MIAAGPSKEISPTFDDGPHPVWTPRVLDALLTVDARATFFVVAPLARRYPRLISEMLALGHSVEFHCVQHVRHPELDRSDIERDARVGLADLELLGIKPSLWRTPWGITSPHTMESAQEFGLKVTGWTEDTHDWRGDTAPSMMEVIVPTLAAGSIILMHDGLGPGARRTGCEETVALIEPFVERIRQLGCEPEPVTPGNITRRGIRA